MSEDLDIQQSGGEEVEHNEPQTEGSYEADPQMEKEARIFGWVPREEFRGNEEDWVDAEAFVKRGKAINPILRKNNEILLKKLESKDREFSELKATVDEFKKFHEETEKRAFERAIKELRSQRREAMEVGDYDKVEQLEEAIDEVKELRNKPKEQPQPQVELPKVDPVFVEWVNENPWYRDDRKMQAITDIIGEEVRAQTDLVGREFLDEVRRRVAKEHPNKFNRKSPVDGGPSASGSGGRTSGKYSARDLPAEDRKVMERFVKEGLVTEAQYLKDYFG